MEICAHKFFSYCYRRGENPFSSTELRLAGNNEELKNLFLILRHINIAPILSIFDHFNDVSIGVGIVHDVITRLECRDKLKRMIL